MHAAVILLVGNKTDLAEQRVISEEEGKELADRLFLALKYYDEFKNNSPHEEGLS